MKIKLFYMSLFFSFCMQAGEQNITTEHLVGIVLKLIDRTYAQDGIISEIIGNKTRSLEVIDTNIDLPIGLQVLIKMQTFYHANKPVGHQMDFIEKIQRIIYPTTNFLIDEKPLCQFQTLWVKKDGMLVAAYNISRCKEGVELVLQDTRDF